VHQLSGLIDTPEGALVQRPRRPAAARDGENWCGRAVPLIELLQLLGWAHVSAGDIELTAGGGLCRGRYADRKQMFADAVLKYVPLAAHIRRVLERASGACAPAARFLRELEDHLSEEEAERVLDTVINWGATKKTEIFAYDYDEKC